MEAGRSRKRLRRSTRSCYQCRKRKVKCQLTDEDVETCAECLKSGTQCTPQAPGAGLNSESSAAHADKPGYESRLDRIELLLKELVESQERLRTVDSSSEIEHAVPASLWNDFLLQPQAEGFFPLVDEHGLDISESPGMLDAKQSLVALLPSAEDAVTIVTNTTAWLWGAESPPGSVLKSTDSFQLLEIAAISSGSALHVSKMLLLFALYMQQLPMEYDMQSLGSQDVEKAIELIVERVKLFILSHEDAACSLDGIECLTLLAAIQLNDGAIRKSWMTFKRLLDICRLAGLGDSFSLSARNSSYAEMALNRRLWLSTVCGDCYCSLLLGLEPGIGIAPFGPDDETWVDVLADGNSNVQRRICLIVARIAQRNAAGLQKDRHILREIDEALNKVQESMPSSWWRAPLFRQNRPLDSAEEPNRLICQLWFFQARIFAHLSIAFAETTNDKLNSLESCMEASRITLHRYLALQHARDQLTRCRSVDHSVFLAAIVLLLAKVELQSPKMEPTMSRYDSDRALIEQVIDSLGSVGKSCRREHIARQISEILSTMLGVVTAGLDDALSAASARGEKGTTRFGMEDIIASSILPVLDAQSPASHLIEILFKTRGPTPSVPKHKQELLYGHTGLGLDVTIDPTNLR